MKNYCIEDREAGRKIFTDDFLAIQDTANALTHMFDVCDQNFVISGCALTISSTTFSIASGYVYIDGEICYFAGHNGTKVAGMSYTLKKQETTLRDAYSDGEQGIIYKNIVAVFSGNETDSSVLDSDRNSGAVSAVGGVFPSFKTAFLDKYCIVKSTTGSSGSTVSISQALQAKAYKFGSCAIEEMSNGSLKISLPSNISGKSTYLMVSKAGQVNIVKEGGSAVLYVNGVNCTNGTIQRLYAESIEGVDQGEPVSIPIISSDEINTSSVNAETVTVSGQVNAKKISNGTAAVEIPKIKCSSIDNTGLGSGVDFEYEDASGNSGWLRMRKISEHIIAITGRIAGLAYNKTTSYDSDHANLCKIVCGGETSSYTCIADKIKAFLATNQSYIPSGDDYVAIPGNAYSLPFFALKINGASSEDPGDVVLEFSNGGTSPNYPKEFIYFNGVYEI